MTECYCRGTGKTKLWYKDHHGDIQSYTEPCRWCKCFSEGAPCPYRDMHGPDSIVIVSESVVGWYLDERDGKRKTMERTKEKRIRYADWDGRCWICYPRGWTANIRRV